MTSLKTLCFACAVFWATAAIGSKVQTVDDKVYDRIVIKADSVVQVGEKFRLSYVLNTKDSLEKKVTPLWSFDEGSTDYQIVHGPSTSTSTSFSMKNGVKSVSYSQTFTYTLVFNKEGIFTLPPMRAETASGKKFQSDSFNVRVVKKGTKVPAVSEKAFKQNDDELLFVEAVVDKNHIALGDSAECEIRLYCNLKCGNISRLSCLSQIATSSAPAYWEKQDHPGQMTMQRVEYKGDTLYSALWKKFAVIPMQAGKVVLEPMKFSIVKEIMDTSDPLDAFFNGGGRVNYKDTVVTSNPVTIQVDNRQLPATDTDIETISPGTHDMGIVIDRSSSLLAKPDSLSASFMELENQFIEQFLPGDSRFHNSVTFFAGKPHYPSYSEMSNILHITPSKENDGSAVYDAVLASALQEGALTTKRPPYSILLLTDGADNASRLSEKTLTNILLKYRIRVDVVAFSSKKLTLCYNLSDSSVMIKNSQDFSDVERIAKATNGLFVLVEDKSLVPAAVRMISKNRQKGATPNRQPEKGFAPDKNLLNSLYKGIISDAKTDF